MDGTRGNYSVVLSFSRLMDICFLFSGWCQILLSNSKFSIGSLLPTFLDHADFKEKQWNWRRLVADKNECLIRSVKFRILEKGMRTIFLNLQTTKRWEKSQIQEG